MMMDPEAPLRILVADDDPTIVELYRYVLGGQGAAGTGPKVDLTICNQGADAVLAARVAKDEGKPFVIAFLDIQMPPGIDGVAAGEMIRRFDPDLQIVFCTVFETASLRDIAQRVLPADRTFFLKKPFHPLEIQQFVLALGARWRSEKQLRELQNFPGPDHWR